MSRGLLCKQSVKKILIFVTAISYFLYTLYWLVKSSNWVVSFFIKPSYYAPSTGFLFTNTYSLYAAYLMDFAAFLGLIARFVGGSYALLSAYLIFKSKTDSFVVVKNNIFKILLCEAFYFLSLVPSIFFLLRFSALPQLSNFLLSAQLFTQILLISPFLVVLAVKTRRYYPQKGKPSILIWTALLFLNYEIALWVSYLLKWGELFNGAKVTLTSVFAWLLISARLLSLLNTIFILSLAVVFAGIGTKFLIKESDGYRATKYWSLSAVFIGAFSILYVLYCIYLGVLWVIPFGEFWIIPLFAVGLYFLVTKAKTTGKG